MIEEYIERHERTENTESIGYVQRLVRCKDCKHWYPLTKTCNNIDGACCQSYVADDWFCADGERKLNNA